ncbi:hypothetical protein [Sphingomonas kyeonggiensis]|uniref:Right-handed parallel beta-helix repeat-containing protein n=1 Tax=Sphingomonas kyeonggiensis TaxID=1268553 RepID=A0A7W6JRW2_9SPHN|nr:hypothetical protein [Sphingomonas kyeonggiensis]MBB4098350.1 hypothetical protein [Sphingomonas kyeonggiensis]
MTSRLVRIAAEGEPVYVVHSGAAYRGVHARDVGNGLFVIRESVRGVQISDVEVAGGYRVIENTSVPREAGADIVGLRVQGAKASDLRRSFARIRYGSHDGVIADVTASGTLTTGAHDLPVGISFADTAHDFRLERCTMRGFQWKRGDNKYWNGDGFSTERGNARILFRQCAAWDNSDGGFDLKSTDSLLDDCTSGRNARNFRLWSSIRATRLTSVNPQKIGGIGDTNHFAIMAAQGLRQPLVIHIEHLVVRSDKAWPIFDVHDGPAHIVIGSHDIQVPPGTPLVRPRGKGSIPGGVTFSGAPPKL